MLGSNNAPFPKPSAKAKLVWRGIFLLIRHLIYTGVIRATFGGALVCQSWPALALGLIPVLDAKAHREERRLRKRLHRDLSHQRRVKALLDTTQSTSLYAPFSYYPHSRFHHRRARTAQQLTRSGKPPADCFNRLIRGKTRIESTTHENPFDGFRAAV